MYLERKNIAVAGAGYVGLSLAVFLARRHHVCIVDVVREKVDMLRRGESPFENRDRPVIGVYRLTMKQGSDNFRESAVLDMIDSLRKKGAEVLIYEPLLKEALPGCRMERDLTRFSTQSDMIIANRLDRQLAQVREKVYTRDVFGRD